MLMESLRSMGYKLETALADVIDNSIAAGARNISVRFLWANGGPWIAILDDGHGMTQPQLLGQRLWVAVNQILAAPLFNLHCAGHER